MMRAYAWLQAVNGASRRCPPRRHLASQPTLSRPIALPSTPANRTVLHEAITELAGRRFRGLRGGHRQRYLTIDVDSLPIEVHGHQPGSAWNSHFHQRTYHPLVASIAETGDLVDARLREGNAPAAEGALDFILDLVDRAEETLCQVALVRIDAGFPSDPLLSGLERHGTPYVARLRTDQGPAPHGSVLSWTAARTASGRAAGVVPRDNLPGEVVVEEAPGGAVGVGAARPISGRSLLADQQP